MPGIHHLDLVVSDLERSLAFYRGLLATARLRPRGPDRRRARRAGRATSTTSAARARSGCASASRTRTASRTTATPSACTTSRSPRRRGGWSTSARRGSPSRAWRSRAARGSTTTCPGYFAVFFFDPDGIKLEIVHVPDDPELAAMIDDLHAPGGAAGESLGDADSDAPGVPADTRRAASERAGSGYAGSVASSPGDPRRLDRRADGSGRRRPRRRRRRRRRPTARRGGR